MNLDKEALIAEQTLQSMLLSYKGKEKMIRQDNSSRKILTCKFIEVILHCNLKPP